MLVLCAAGLGLAFQGGSYLPADWLPYVIGITALAVVMCISGPAVCSGRWPKVLLAVLGVLALWTAASLFWTTSLANTWEELNRTLFYLVVVALVFAAVRWAGPAGTRVLAWSVTALITATAVVMVVSFAVSDDPAQYWASSRLQYPITYFNALAAFLMIGFWLSMGLANGFGGRPVASTVAADGAPAPTGGVAPAEGVASGPGAADGGSRWRAVALRGLQPLLLALGVFVLELALLPQSRGAFWAFFMTVPFFVVLSTNRFRALTHLAIVILPVVLFWSRINGVWLALRDNAPLEPALGTALRAIGYSVLIAVGLWAVTYAVERVVGPLSRRVTVWVGALLIVLAVGAAVGGLVYLDSRTGGLDGYVHDRWEEMTSDAGGAGAGGGSRFVSLGLNGRWRMWRVAAQAFEDHPVLGVGAQNYEFYYNLHREIPVDVKQPHSLPMRLLAELGLPGFVLWVVFVIAALVGAAVYRFRVRGRMSQAVTAAMMVAVISWLIHSSADWLWQIAGTSLPAVVLLGGLVATSVRVQLPGAAPSGEAAGAPASETPPAPAVSPSIARRRSFTRPLLTALALAVLVSAALPYLSLRYAQLAGGARDLDTVVARTQTALRLDPTTIQPYAVRANAHQVAAEQQPADSPARVQQLILAASDWIAALDREPDNWLCYYKIAQMTLAARDAALATDPASAEELTRTARTYLNEARRLNPLSREIDALEKAF